MFLCILMMMMMMMMMKDTFFFVGEYGLILTYIDVSYPQFL